MKRSAILEVLWLAANAPAVHKRVMQFISDFADGAVVLPLVLLVWAVSAVMGFQAVMRRWVLAVALVLLTMLAFKAAWFLLATLTGVPVVSPSGHTASAGIVYGGLAWLSLRRLASPAIAAAVPLAIAALIGVSRIELGAHTPVEVLLGAAVGLAGLAAFTRFAGSDHQFKLWPVLVAGLVVMPVMHGHRLPVERQLRSEILGR